MFLPAAVYHIYNHANGEENIFREEKNYKFFLHKYFKYADPVAETFAYCLMPNHFHAMIRIRGEEELVEKFNLRAVENFEGSTKEEFLSLKIGKCFSNLFNSYAKAVNKVYDRRGSLFQQNMKKKMAENDKYFTQLVLYIHNNPVKHGFVSNPREWQHSSIHLFNPDVDGYQNLQGFKTKINCKAVLDLFGDYYSFKVAHEGIKEIRRFSIEVLINKKLINYYRPPRF